MIIIHMLIFTTNYILSILSFCYLLDSNPCSLNLSLTNHMYGIGDEVLFKGSPELYIFLGEKQIHQHDDEGQDEYLAEFRAPREPSYPSQLIQFKLYH